MSHKGNHRKGPTALNPTKADLFNDRLAGLALPPRTLRQQAQPRTKSAQPLVKSGHNATLTDAQKHALATDQDFLQAAADYKAYNDRVAKRGSAQGEEHSENWYLRNRTTARKRALAKLNEGRQPPKRPYEFKSLGYRQAGNKAGIPVSNDEMRILAADAEYMAATKVLYDYLARTKAAGTRKGEPISYDTLKRAQTIARLNALKNK